MTPQRLTELCRIRSEEFEDFVNDLGLSTNYQITFEVGDKKEFPETRNLAYTAKIGKNKCEIVFAPKWYLSEENFDAVLRHEFAHALHFIHPKIFKVLRKNGLFFNPECHEIFADKLAELIFGERIYYDQDLIQTLQESPTKSRPYRLGW